MQFVHQGGNLGCVVDMLLCLSRGRTRAELKMHLAEYRATSRMLSFLCEQELVRLLKGKRNGEAVYRAIPNAIDELVHRLKHEGEEGPIPNDYDEMATKRAAARDTVKAALQAGGWRGRGGVKVRIV
jgi:hypothetical protein